MYVDSLTALSSVTVNFLELLFVTVPDGNSEYHDAILTNNSLDTSSSQSKPDIHISCNNIFPLIINGDINPNGSSIYCANPL